MTARHRKSVGGAVSRREIALWSALAVGASVALLWGWWWNVALNDYATEAAPSMTALLHGHITAFLQSAPSYGASLLLRAPFALPGSLAGGSTLLVYRLGALPCLLAIGALGVWLAVDLRRAGGALLAAGLAVALCVANPITYRALATGHPEELLGGALCVAAVLLAQRGRANLAALALGLAIANKQWALLAIGPVFIALPAHRVRSLIIAGVVAGALVAPIMLSSPTIKAATSRLVVADTGTIFNPWQIFWFFGSRGHWLPSMLGSIPRGFRLPPAWLGGRAHLLIVWLGLPLTMLAAYRRTRAADALLLLALLLLLRCWLDPWDLVYYPLPFIFALLAWETTVARRPPIGAAAATAATWLIFWYLPAHIGVDAQAVSFLAPATLTLAALSAAVYRLRPLRRPARAGARLSRAPAVPS
ncbi:MAG: hypothetical protein ABSD82_05255 [Solirubrobacteraceae bacterium]